MPSSANFVLISTLTGFVALPALALAQSPPPQVTLPTVTVSAQKEPADPQTLPVTVTTVPADWLEMARITWLSDAAIFAPNTVITEFTARKLSNPRIRGVGASPANAAVGTYVDGVPVLNSNASSMEFTGIEQVEFVRGPQSALFGRNTLAGLINITSQRPSLSDWTGDVVAPLGNFDARDVRGSLSGPLSSVLALGVSAGRAERDGFTINTLTGNDLDSRAATFGKAQLLFTPSSRWETRLIVSGEDANDGDYALNDLDAVRANPFEVAHDFEGYTHRSLLNTTVLNRYEGSAVSITATTGFLRWDTDDQTDLDYTPLPLATRSNVEEASQFTQEVRIASAPGRTVALSAATTLKWQAVETNQRALLAPAQRTRDCAQPPASVAQVADHEIASCRFRAPDRTEEICLEALQAGQGSRNRPGQAPPARRPSSRITQSQRVRKDAASRNARR
jgi:iron complex outermembrane receptor protein